MNYARYGTPLVLLIVWQSLSSCGILPYYRLPSPLEILAGFTDLVLLGLPPGYLLHKHILYSLYRVGIGYLAAAGLAIPLGLLMGWSPKLRSVLNPPVEMLRPIPPLAWIPLSILWFGLGITSSAFIIFLEFSFRFS